MAKIIATVDLGTSSLRTTLWNQNGKILANAVKAYPTYRPKPDCAEQQPEDWWKAFIMTFKKAAGRSAKNVRAIVVASQREGMVPVDSSGKTLSSCIIWMDNRTGPQLDKVRGLFKDTEVYRITGLSPALYYSACKILWIMQHQPRIHQEASFYLQPGDYLVMQLTGNSIADLSMASRTMLLDVRRRTWSRKMLHDLAIPAEKLPLLQEPGTIAGAVQKRVAKKLGLPAGVEVIIGAGDQQCGALGCGAIDEKTVSASLGTSTTVSLSVTRPHLSARTKLPCCISAVPGMWEMEPSLWSSGSLLNWLDDRLNGKRNSIKKLLSEAEKVPPGSDGLLLLPYFMGAGSPNWNPDARGAFVGLTLGHSNGHLTRAILEGNAYDIRMNIEALNKCGFYPQRIVVNGGGAQSALWCQTIADVTGLPVDVPRTTEAVSLGLFLIAHTTLGYSRSLKSAARKFIHMIRRHLPNRARHCLYNCLFKEFEKLAGILDPFYRSYRKEFLSFTQKRRGLK